MREIRRVCQALPFGEDRISDGPGFLKVVWGVVSPGVPNA